MELTWLGAVLIPLGILSFLFVPNRLLYLAIFFVGFTASSTIDLSSGKPISALHLFGALFMLHRVFSFIVNGKMRTLAEGDKSLSFLLLFMFVSIISMIMPIVIDGSLVISSNQLSNLYMEPLRLTGSNITRPLPVIFGVLFAVFLVYATDSPEKVRRLVRVFVFSGIFVAAWGIFQFLCIYVFNIDYPDYIFNNSKIDTARGFAQQLGVDDESIKRLSSVTHEPSVLAKYLLTVAPVLMCTIWFNTPLLGLLRDRIALILIITVILLATSTTGYFGTLVVFCACSMIVGRYRPIKYQVFGWLFLVAGGLLFVLLVFPSAQKALNLILISKLDSYSAIERTLSISNSWDYFLEYPLLGVGWGMVTINDLSVNLLVNTGIIGFLAFFALIFYLIYRSLRTLDLFRVVEVRQIKLLRSICAGLLVSLITLIIEGIVTGIEFYLGYFYAVVGMLIASVAVLRKQVKSESGSRSSAIQFDAGKLRRV